MNSSLNTFMEQMIETFESPFDLEQKILPVDDFKPSKKQNVFEKSKIIDKIQETTVVIDGMLYLTCAESIKSKLNEIDGIYSVFVSLEEHSGRFLYDPLKISLTDIKETIEHMGFNVNFERTVEEKPTHSIQNVEFIDEYPSIETFVISIDGMSCSSCVSLIEKELCLNSAIKNVSISLLTKKAEITVDCNVLKHEDICSIIRSIGFEAKVSFDISKSSIQLKLVNELYFNLEEFINKIMKVDGILFVSSKKKLLTVNFNEKVVGPRTIVDFIEKEGIEVNVVQEDLSLFNYQKETKLWKKRFIVSFGLFLPSFVSMQTMKYSIVVHHILMKKVLSGLTLMNLISFILSSTINIFVGVFFYSSSIKSLFHFNMNMDVLISLGSLSSYLYSLYFTIASLITGILFSFLIFFYSKTGLTSEKVFFETSLMLFTFVSLGRWLEKIAKGKASESLEKLVNFKPTKAILLEDNANQREITIELVQKGDKILVLAGSKIPIDGIIRSGESYIDQSLVTGESRPIYKKFNDSVFGGTINHSGVLIVESTTIGTKSTLYQMWNLVQQSQMSKMPLQRLSDKLASYFVPSVILASVLTFSVWISILSLKVAFPPEGSSILHFSLQFSISVLVVSCPCAIGLAAPVAVMVGTGLGAQHGILIKGNDNVGGEILENIIHLTTVCFDKTGTLTEGTPVVYKMVLFTNMSEKTFLEYVYAGELQSEHIYSKAIQNYAFDQLKYVPSLQGEDVKNFFGQGIQFYINSHLIRIGSIQWIRQYSNLSKNVLNAISENHAMGLTVSLVLKDNEIVGMFVFKDKVREDSKETIEWLHLNGIKTFLFTGDTETISQELAGQLGISKENVFFDLLPKDKLERIKKLQMNGEVVVMVGDGINDSPALSQSHIGIAMGKGTDLTIEAADIILLNNNLYSIVHAIELSRRTVKRIKYNLFFAIIYNLVSIPVAAGVLLKLDIIMNPGIASALMISSSLTVLTSCLFLSFPSKCESSFFEKLMMQLQNFPLYHKYYSEQKYTRIEENKPTILT